MTTVGPLEPGEQAAYDAYVGSHPDALVYVTRKYMEVLKRLLGCGEHTLVARRGAEIEGVMPILYADAASGRIYNSLPYYGSNGGILASDTQAGEALAEAWDALIESGATAGGTVITNPFATRPHPTLRHNLQDERIAQFTHLTADVMNRVDSSARRNVRKAERSGYQVEIAANTDTFASLYELHEANIRAIGGRPKAREFFGLVHETMAPGREYDLWVARSGGRVAAALLVLLFNGTVEYFTPAIQHEHRSQQPLALIIRDAFEHYRSQGFRIWNWGGTWHSQTGLRRFKLKWGAEERLYPYFVQVNAASLIEADASDILASYSGFYVLPFSALQPSGGAQSARS